MGKNSYLINNHFASRLSTTYHISILSIIGKTPPPGACTILEHSLVNVLLEVVVVVVVVEVVIVSGYLSILILS